MEQNNDSREKVDQRYLFEIKTTELDNINKSISEERKSRGKREFILLITCLIAFLYTYPVENFENNPNIKIPAISLEIPIKDAIGVFPTIIAAIYLVFLSSAISQSILMLKRHLLNDELDCFQETGTFPTDQTTSVFNIKLRISTIGYLILPSPLHTREFMKGIAFFSKLIVDTFVGLVFTSIPYLTMIFISMKSWSLLNNKLILVWNSLCLIIMVSGFLSAFFSSFREVTPKHLKKKMEAQPL